MYECKNACFILNHPALKSGTFEIEVGQLKFKKYNTKVFGNQ